MDRSNDWLAPLTGAGFVIVGIISFAVGGEPKSADEPAREIVDFYVDNKDSIMVGGFLTVLAGLLLVFFGAHLRKVLHRAAGQDESLSLVAFIGLCIVATGFAIDATIAFALAEAADDIEPTAVQALQALWDNDFLPIALGTALFLLATGLSIVRTGVLPRWLGWVMVVLGILGFTPIGFVSAIAAAILVLVLSVMLSLRARGPAAPA